MVKLALAEQLARDAIDIESLYGMYCAGYSVSTPDVQKYEIEIPGRSGVLDFSEALGLFYNNRNIAFTEVCHIPHTLWANKYSQIANKWHGKRVKVIFDDQAEWYYIGRCTCTPLFKDNDTHGVKFEINAEPFKYPADRDGNNWLWDPFNFEVGVIREYEHIVISGQLTVNVLGYERPEAPQIVSSAPMTLLVDDTDTYNILAGTNIFPDLLISSETIEDVHTFKFTGNGFVTINLKGGII